MIDAPSSRAVLDQALATAEPHLRPVILAVRDLACGMLMVRQGSQPFRLPRDPRRAGIVIVGDDMGHAIGPAGFHMPSVRRAIRSCHAFAVVSCEALPEVYERIALTAAITRRNVMLVETLPSEEIAWASLIQKLAPGKPLCLALVEGARN